jgi:hypothetical protein
MKLRHLNSGYWHPAHQSARGRAGISGTLQCRISPLAEFKLTYTNRSGSRHPSKSQNVHRDRSRPSYASGGRSAERFDSVDQEHGSPESRRCRLPIRCAFSSVIRSSLDPHDNCCIGSYRRRAPLLALLPNDRSYLGAARVPVSIADRCAAPASRVLNPHPVHV